MAGPIRISILANASQAKAELNSTLTTTEKIGAGFRKMALPAAAALAGIGKASLDAAKAAAEDDAAQSKLANTLKNTAGATDTQVASTEKWIAAQGKALGVSDDELRPALGKLATVTGSVGKAQKLASLAMDVSAGSGKSLSSVTDALMKAQNGSLGGLSRLGVATKNADGSTKSLAQVTKDLADTYKNSASTAAETAAGKQKRLQVALGELQEEIGAKLLPVLQKMAEIGLQAVQWIGDNTGKVTALVGIIAGLSAAVLIVNAAMSAASAVMAIYHATTTILSTATKAFAAAQWLVNAALTANPIGLVVVAIAALVAGLVLAYKNSDTFREAVDKAFQFLKDKIPPILEVIKNAVVKTFNFLKDFVNDPVGTMKDAIVKGWTAIKDKTSELWDKVKEVVRDKVDDAVEKAKDLKTKVVAFFASAPSWLLNEGRQLVQGLIGGIGEKFEALREKMENAKDAIGNKFVNAVTFLLAEGRQIVSGLIGGIGEKFSDLAEKAGDIKTKVTDKFTTAATWLYDTGKNIVQGLINGIQALAGEATQAAVNLVKNAMDAAKKFLKLGSPSKLTRQFGEWTGEGLVIGIDRTVNDAKKAAERLAGAVVTGYGEPALAVGLDAASAYRSSSSSSTQKVEITLTAQQLDALSRGRAIQADLDAYARAGGRPRA